MILQIRHGKHLYEVDVPRGSQLQSTSTGRRVLVIPGPRPLDTATWLPAPSIVGAARLGQFGLALRSERRLVLCP